MHQRIAYEQVAPDGIRIMRQFEQYIKQCGLEHGLVELVKTRVSQINRCAYCIDMHTKDARAAGETEQRLYALSAWRETPFFTPRERAALAWAEALTLLPESAVEDELFEEVRQHFSEKELVDLTIAINTINSWNRIAVPFRKVPGTYQPPRRPAEHAVSA